MGINVVEPSLFSSLDPVVLQGSVCAACAAHVFPAQGTCPMCAGTEVARVPLPTAGVVWSWTTQNLAPKPPFRTDGFAPFSIGYVDLGPVIVEGWLLGKNNWIVGEPVRLALAKAWTEDGDTVFTYGFEVTA